MKTIQLIPTFLNRAPPHVAWHLAWASTPLQMPLLLSVLSREAGMGTALLAKLRC